MPGTYARTMTDICASGNWDRSLLAKMLHRNTLVANHPTWQLNLFINENNLASCHPAAIRFMNMLRPGLFPGDDVFGLGDGKINDAARADIDAATVAVNANDQAIWVRYGGANGHSFVLLTGGGNENTLESFEAWAGEEGGYSFDLSVWAEPDAIGYPRTNRLTTTTRTAVITALHDLLDPSLEVRSAAVNVMSRAGVDGFGNNALGSNVPGLDIHVAASQGLAGFSNTVRSRLTEVGYICAYTEHMRSGGTHYVCCRCQDMTLSQQAASRQHWRACATCTRHYCQQCKHLLASRPRASVFHTRVRICDCGQDTARI